VRPRARSKWVFVRSGTVEAGRGDLDAIGVEVRLKHLRDAFAEGVVDALRVVDEDAEALAAVKLEGEHLDAGDRSFDHACHLALQLRLLLVRSFGQLGKSPI